ncbi:hypothetical protein [uncultured Methanospirillum sp.]|uniref:hypothetical protein n=1 Tax=uncultured Methanospirillum sp. TaxID=262503 RepID=UPI0029C91A6F|nr:hypothetical protein [uncultured Methanospirillum sp.]
MDDAINTLAPSLPELKGLNTFDPHTNITPEVSEEEIRQRSLSIITELVKKQPKAKKAWSLLSRDPDLAVHWECANYITVEKLGMNDHGRVHAIVATASALQILEYLIAADILPDILSSGMGDIDDAYLIVLTAALCHDIGNEIHRTDHISHSLLLVSPILDRILPQIYDDQDRMARVRTFILGSIYTHHGDPRPLTIEAGAVCIGDATDMTTGRARTAYDQGRVSIHTISALSIDMVLIEQGSDLPVVITIHMSNSAGLFQVQEILGPKIAAGPLTPYIEVRIQCTGESDGSEKQILSGMKFVQGLLIR